MTSNAPLSKHYESADKMMLMISYGLTLYSLVLASWYDTWAEAIIIGAGSAIALTAIYSLAKGSLLSRVAMASGFMIYTALHIHQAHGMIEMHFGVFALLALLLFYRHWLPIVVAAGVIAAHHLVFFYLQTSGSGVWVLESTESGLWIIFLHAAYVIAETGLLVWFASNLNREATQSLELLNVTDLILRNECIDLTQRTSGLTAVLKRFDNYTDDVESLAKQVRNSSTQLSDTGEALSSITAEMKEAAQTQQRETDMIATAVEEMSTAIVEVSRNAEHTAASSNQVDSNAQEATQVSHNTQAAVQKLAEQIADASKTMEALNEQTNRIGSVLDVIRGIAEQTNLLALNAAIEAARAGEQGRGFAVVADEVRTLAQRTQQSTQEIDTMIEQLQAGSHNAVQVIESSRNQAQACVSNTQDALALMEKVSGATRDINAMNANIAAAATQQSDVIEEISKNLTNILTSSQRAAGDAERAVASATTLRHVADQLNLLSQRFHVSD